MNGMKWTKVDTFTLVVSLVVIGIMLTLLFECKRQTERADKLQHEFDSIKIENEYLDKYLLHFVSKNRGMRERLEGKPRPAQPASDEPQYEETSLSNAQSGWDEADKLLGNLKDK